MAETGVRDAVGLVADEVRELVRRGRLDPAREPEQVRRLVDEVVADYDERALTSDLPPLMDRRRTASQVWDAVAGYGPLQRHLDDPEIEEVWVNDRLTAGSPNVNPRASPQCSVEGRPTDAPPFETLPTQLGPAGGPEHPGAPGLGACSCRQSTVGVSPLMRVL